MMVEEREVVLEAKSWRQAWQVAERDTQHETGGILLGWRLENGVYVSAAVEVPDRHAGRSLYRRRHEEAEAMLEDALAKLPADSVVGYVGEWHVHPALCGPSWLDRRELRRISKKALGTIALLVCARDTNAGTWVPYGACATDGRIHRAAVHITGENDA